jgi:hypothetical protein
VDVAAEEEVRLPAPLGRPAARSDEAIPLRDAARRGEEEGESQIGGRLGEDARRVADGNPAPFGGQEVDVVDTHRAARDDAEARAGVQQRAVDAVGEDAEQPLGVPRFGPERLRRRRATAGPDAERTPVSQAPKGRARKRPRGVDPRSHGHRSVVYRRRGLESRVRTVLFLGPGAGCPRESEPEEAPAFRNERRSAAVSAVG